MSTSCGWGLLWQPQGFGYNNNYRTEPVEQNYGYYERGKAKSTQAQSATQSFMVDAGFDWRTVEPLNSLIATTIPRESNDNNSRSSVTPQSSRSWLRPELERTEDNQKQYLFPIWTIIRI